MELRSLMGTFLVAGSFWLASEASAAAPPSSTADQRQPTQVSISSRISEVDACNLGQYQIPNGSVLQGFRYGVSQDKDGPLFTCTVSWSNDSKAAAPGRPILFPNPTPIPLIWSGWF